MTTDHTIELFAWRDAVRGAAGTVEVAFTDGRLDLGDRAEAPAREALLSRLEQETAAVSRIMHQVHGADIQVLEDGAADGGPRVDALVTGEPGVALIARAADCLPLLLADPDAGLVGAVHAGRAGLALNVTGSAVRRLRDLGADRLVAWIGPHVCGACYEVPLDLRAEVAAAVPEAWGQTRWGTPALDLGRGVRAQLAAAGVADVRGLEACTREDPAWPSYRRDGQAAGRFAAVVWRR